MGYYPSLWLGDWTILLLIPGLILGLVAQASVKNTYRKYAQVGNRRGITANDAARSILYAQGISIPIQPISGTLTDNYDPKNRVLNLSQGVYGSSSIAALGVAAHEAGHACQHAEEYVPLKLRSAMVPVVNLGSNAVFPIILIGIFIQSQFMLNLAIYLYMGVVLFQLVTLPVEFNASRRALAVLESGGYLAQDEMVGARKVLRAAAMTYVASALSAMLQLLRLILLYGGRRRD